MHGHEKLNIPGSFNNIGLNTLPDIFQYAIEKYGTLAAIKKRHSWGHQSISFQEFGKLVSFLGSGLIDRGLKHGDRVALMAENSPEWLLVYAAVTSCGAIIVPLDTNLQKNELRHLLLHCEAGSMIVSPGIFNDLVEEMKFEDIDLIVIGEKDPGLKAVSLGEVMASGKEKINNGDTGFFQRKTEVRPEDIAAICYTSGTTGQPKGAVLLHSNLVANVESLSCIVRFSDADAFLCLLPLYHTFPVMSVFLTPVYNGSTIVFARSIKPKIILEDIVKERITVIVAVPILYEHLSPYLTPVKKGKKSGTGRIKRFFLRVAVGMGRLFGKKKASEKMQRKIVTAGMENIRLCFTGAAALRPDIEQAFIDAEIPLIQGYGMTETSPVISMNLPDRPKKGTVGLALPGVEVVIDSPDSQGVGEILVKGPNVMKEYYKNPEATSNVLRGGYLYTGDLGKIDEEGYITVSGRIKSLIVTAGGKNIFPDELEAMLDKNIYILESVVLPVEDRKGNTRPGAVIVPDYDMLGSVKELKGSLTDENVHRFIGEEIRAIFENVPDYKHLIGFRIRDSELPKTTTRKVKRHLVSWIRE
ncbi:MAG: AMP-binding protein [Candidatus Krumholzibacteriota bacterium]|nr:AMP-binding protein [Candidatus Krumholzibacteriota bacterium]